MAFISVADELTQKSATSVENKFITKYLAELEPVSVKVYLYALYLYQNGKTAYTLEDFAKKLNLDEDTVKDYFEYLDEFELVSVTSRAPFEIKILDCENFYGKPKNCTPKNTKDFTKRFRRLFRAEWFRRTNSGTISSYSKTTVLNATQ